MPCALSLLPLQNNAITIKHLFITPYNLTLTKNSLIYKVVHSTVAPEVVTTLAILSAITIKRFAVEWEVK